MIWLAGAINLRETVNSVEVSASWVHLSNVLVSGEIVPMISMVATFSPLARVSVGTSIVLIKFAS